MRGHSGHFAAHNCMTSITWSLFDQIVHGPSFQKSMGDIHAELLAKYLGSEITFCVCFFFSFSLPLSRSLILSLSPRLRFTLSLYSFFSSLFFSLFSFDWYSLYSLGSPIGVHTPTRTSCIWRTTDQAITVTCCRKCMRHISGTPASRRTLCLRRWGASGETKSSNTEERETRRK